MRYAFLGENLACQVGATGTNDNGPGGKMRGLLDGANVRNSHGFCLIRAFYWVIILAKGLGGLALALGSFVSFGSVKILRISMNLVYGGCRSGNTFLAELA